MLMARLDGEAKGMAERNIQIIGDFLQGTVTTNEKGRER